MPLESFDISWSPSTFCAPLDRAHCSIVDMSRCAYSFVTSMMPLLLVVAPPPMAPFMLKACRVGICVLDRVWVIPVVDRVETYEYSHGVVKDETVER